MKKLRVVFMLLIVLAIFSIEAQAWSNPGHMLVALIAYKKLTPKVRARVDLLVAMNPKIEEFRAEIPAGTSAADTKMMLFMMAAAWPDHIKGDPEYDNPDGPNGGNTPPDDKKQANLNIGYQDKFLHKYWHFVDRPFSTDGTPLIPANVPNAEIQIKIFTKILASSAKDALKSYDLVWLLHLVGDVHQPLHATARFDKTQPKGDDGGNGVTVIVECKIIDGKEKCLEEKLHSFWDGQFGSSRDLGDSVQLAIDAEKDIPQAPNAAANNLNVSSWINESFNIAKTEVYMKPTIGEGKGPFTLTPDYRTAAKDLAGKRVALGGARLANILNKRLR